MKKKKTHISFKVLGLILALAIITPTLIKFSHEFQNHEHEFCLGESTSHFHKLDIECDFYKFKLNTQYVHFLNLIDFLKIETLNTEVKSYYYFVSDFKKLQVSPRGPPSIV